MLAVDGGHEVRMKPRPQSIVCALKTLVRVVEPAGQVGVLRESELELCGEVTCPVGDRLTH